MRLKELIFSHMCIHCHDSGLIWLRNICENDIDHTDKHTVTEGLSGVFDDWDNVGPVCSHVDEISSRSVREFNREDCACRADHIRNV